MPTATRATQFMFLSERRFEESSSLLQKGHFHGAFYLAGYVIECALKAALAKFIGNGELPKELRVHDLAVLSQTLTPHLNSADALLSIQSIPNWTHLARYDTSSPTAVATIRMLTCAKDVKICLSKLL